MATLTVKYTKHIEQKIEVSFPLFKQHGSAVYKIQSEKDWIEVYCNHDKKEIAVTDKGFCYSHLVLCEGAEISEEKFDARYQEALETILKAKGGIA